MIKDYQEVFLNKRYLGYIGGPIFFTAPHSKKLWRGSEKYSQVRTIHKREIFTGWLAIKFASMTGKKGKRNSFMVWGKDNEGYQDDADPNYLRKPDFTDSPFHLSLHAWAIKNQKVPLLHVDIHGKENRENNVQIDVGKASMEAHWPEDPLLQYFRPFFQQELTGIFQGMLFRDMKCRFNTNPFLHGYWGWQIHTMTEQAIMLGIPSFQLEIPYEIRCKLLKSPQLLKKLGDGLKGFYEKIIVPYYSKKTQPLKISKQLALKYKVTVADEKLMQAILSQYEVYDTKKNEDPQSTGF